MPLSHSLCCKLQFAARPEKLQLGFKRSCFVALYTRQNHQLHTASSPLAPLMLAIVVRPDAILWRGGPKSAGVQQTHGARRRGMPCTIAHGASSGQPAAKVFLQGEARGASGCTYAVAITRTSNAAAPSFLL